LARTQAIQVMYLKINGRRVSNCFRHLDTLITIALTYDVTKPVHATERMMLKAAVEPISIKEMIQVKISVT
jgi:hypothetical protein